MPHNNQLEKEISNSLANYSTKFEWDDDFYDISVTYESKKVKVGWVFSVRWIRFRFYMSDETIYESTARYGKHMSLADIWDKTAEVIIRYLNLPYQVITRGKWSKVLYLEVNEKGQWVDIFNNFRRNKIKLKVPRTSGLAYVFNQSPRSPKPIESPRDDQLGKDITNAFKEYSMDLAMDEGVYFCTITKGLKRIKIDWPYKVHEVYIDFFENEEKIFHDWFDFYTGETNSEILDYLTLIVNRFVNLPNRIITQGKWLKITNLEVYENGKWVNIFEYSEK